jgi:pyruvate dehydrogenase E2 component (dihydrolipoamide acetyltransferase)
MSREMRFTDPGEGLHEGEIAEVLVAEGDRVQEGDSVLAVETDKATTELPAPYAGAVERVAVAVGDRVQIGDLLLRFADDDAAPAQARAERSTGAPEAEADQRRREPADPDADQDQDEAAGDEFAPAAAGASGAGAKDRKQRAPVPAAPSTRRLARERGVALEDLDGSGPGGRVLAEDVRQAAESGARDGGGEQAPEPPSAAAPQHGAAAWEPPDFSRWGEVEKVPLRSVRRATAREMARAWAEIPHVMHHDLADVTALERFRRAHAADIDAAGGTLTLTVLVLKAAAAALRAMPRFNASLDADGETIVLKHYCHMGVAVATERGLMVPVIRDVDRKPVRELAAELPQLARRARDGALSRDEMQGGCFTVTNIGGIGGRLFTPIIRHPEAAILGLARAELTPVASGSSDAPEITARLLLPLCLAFDHRLNDGADAAQFVNRIMDSLRDPESLLLSIQ